MGFSKTKTNPSFQIPTNLNPAQTLSYQGTSGRGSHLPSSLDLEFSARMGQSHALEPCLPSSVTITHNEGRLKRNHKFHLLTLETEQI